MKNFAGNLQEIDPSKIIDKNNQNELDDFFLVLGLIYNDLKGLIFFYRILEEEYKPISHEISAHNGEYGGMQLQINKLIISLVSEFLVFLRKNKMVINSPRFLLLEKSLPKRTKNLWRDICATSIDRGKDQKDNFFSRIAEVRSNIVFHYDHSGTQLKSGFVKKFFDVEKDESNKKAFYSFGNEMKSTRFYYCDGAVEEYLKEHLAGKNNDYLKEAINLVDDMNQAIYLLMKEYFAYKK